MVFSSRKNSITLIYQDQRGSLFFLVVDQGTSVCEKLFSRGRRVISGVIHVEKRFKI